MAEVTVPVPEPKEEDNRNVVEQAGDFLDRNVVQPVQENIIEPVGEFLQENVAEPVSEAVEEASIALTPSPETITLTEGTLESQLEQERKEATMFSRGNIDTTFHNYFKTNEQIGTLSVGTGSRKVASNVNEDDYSNAFMFSLFLNDEVQLSEEQMPQLVDSYNRVRQQYINTVGSFIDKNRGTMLPFTDPETGDMYKELPENFSFLGLDMESDYTTIRNNQKEFNGFLRNSVFPQVGVTLPETKGLMIDALTTGFATGVPVIEAGRGATDMIRDTGLFAFVQAEGARAGVSNIMTKYAPRIAGAILDEMGFGEEQEVLGERVGLSQRLSNIMQDMNNDRTKYMAELEQFFESQPFLSEVGNLNAVIKDHVVKQRGEEYYEANKDNLVLNPDQAKDIYRFSTRQNSMAQAAYYLGEGIASTTAVIKATRLKDRATREALSLREAGVLTPGVSMVDLAKATAAKTKSDMNAFNRILYNTTFPESRATGRAGLGEDLLNKAGIEKNSIAALENKIRKKYSLENVKGKELEVKKLDEEINQLKNGMLEQAVRASSGFRNPIHFKTLSEEAPAAALGGIFVANFFPDSPNADLYASAVMIPGAVIGDVASAGVKKYMPATHTAVARTLGGYRKLTSTPEGTELIKSGLLDPSNKPTPNFPYDYEINGKPLDDNQIKLVLEMQKNLSKFTPTQRQFMLESVRKQSEYNKKITAPFRARIAEIDNRIAQATNPEEASVLARRKTTLETAITRIDEAIERPLGYALGVAHYAAYVNRIVNNPTMDFSKLRKGGEDLRRAFQLQIESEKSQEQADLVIQDLQNLVAGVDIGEDTDILRTATANFIDQFRTDAARRREMINANKDLLKESTNQYLSSLSADVNFATMTDEEFDETIGDAIDLMRADSIRPFEELGVEQVGDEAVTSAQTGLDEFKNRRDQFLADIRSSLTKSRDRLQDMSDGDSSLVAYNVDKKLESLYKIGEVKRAGVQAEIYGPLDSFDEIDATDAMSDIIIQFTRVGKDPFAQFGAEFTAQVPGLARKVKKSVNTAVMEGILKQARSIDSDADVNDIVQMFQELVEERGEEVAGFIKDRFDLASFTKDDINLGHMFIYGREKGFVPDEVSMIQTGEGDFVPTKDFAMTMSFENLHQMYEVARKSVGKMSTDSPNYARSLNALNNLESVLRKNGDEAIVPGMDKTVSQYLDESSFRYRLEVGERYDTEYSDVPSLLGIVRNHRKNTIQRSGLASKSIYNTVFGDNFIRLFAGTADQRRLAREEHKQTLEKAFGVPTVDGVRLDKWLESNIVDQNTAQQLVEEGRVRYSIDQLTPEEFEEVKPELISLHRLMFEESFGSQINPYATGDKAARRFVTEEGAKKDSFIFNVPQALSEDENYYDVIEDAFSVTVGGEKVMLIDPFDYVGETVEDMVGVTQDVRKFERESRRAINVVKAEVNKGFIADKVTLELSSQKAQKVLEEAGKNINDLFGGDTRAIDLDTLVTYYERTAPDQVPELKSTLRYMFSEYVYNEVGGLKASDAVSRATGKNIKVLDTPQDIGGYFDDPRTQEVLEILDIDAEHAESIQGFAQSISLKKLDESKRGSTTGIPHDMSMASKASRIHNVVRGIVAPQYYIIEAGFNMMQRKNVEFMNFMLSSKEGAQLSYALISDPMSFKQSDYALLSERIIGYLLSGGVSENEITTELETVIEDTRKIAERIFD